MKNAIPTPGAPGRSLLRCAQAAVVLLGAAFIATQFGELHFTLDNLSNFPVHFAAAFLLCTAALLWYGDRRFAILAAAGVALSLMPVLPWYFADTSAAPAPEARTVKLLVSNVYVHNRQHARILALIDAEQPDIVGLVEVNSRWLRKVARLHASYPYHLEIPDEDYVGLALFSRLPLTDARVIRVGDAGNPAIAATLATPDGEIEFILAHPASPLDRNYVQRRNAQLRELGRYVGSLKRPVVIAGDLNVTMWNRNYGEFAAQGGLHNARAGRGIGPTWPAVWPFGVPIDHVLATAPVRFRSFRVLQRVGSDHLPISAEFSLR